MHFFHSSIQFQPTIEQDAAIEVEGIPSKGLSLYDQSHQKIGQLVYPNVSYANIKFGEITQFQVVYLGFYEWTKL